MVDDLRADAPIEFQSKLTWTRISSSKAKAAGEQKELMHEPRSGTVLQFLDEFEGEAMAKFPFHKFTIVRQKAMAAEFERNRCPGWLQFDVDFAENGPIITAEEVQSQYWLVNTFTLFVQVVSFLVSDAWISRTSRLACGMAVTVELDGASEPGAIQPGKGSFWAEVVCVPTVDAGACDEALQAQMYGVQRHGAAEGSAPQQVRRALLRHRKLHTKAVFGITDDKKHDSYAAQWFMNATLQILKLAYVDTGIERFFATHVHSDNAGSHFKSSKTMFFMSTLLAICAAWPVAVPAGVVAMSARAFWEFGPPGHGKGVWDGLGALVKRTVKQDIIDGVALTTSKRTTSAKELAEHVRARFSTGEWKASHADMTINEIIVVYGSTEEIHGTRPQPDHE